MYPRLKRKRSKTFVRPMSYTGITSRPKRREPRSAMGSVPMTSTTTLPEQPEQPTDVLGLLAAKRAYDNIGDMYETGQKAREGVLGLPEKVGNVWDKVSDYLPDMGFGGNEQMASQVAQSLPTDFSIVDGTITSLGGNAVGANSMYTGGETSGLLGDSTGAMADGTSAVTGMQVPKATLGNVLAGAGALYGLGSGIAEGNTGQAIGSGLSLAMMMNPATLPFSWIPAVGGTLMDDWF